MKKLNTKRGKRPTRPQKMGMMKNGFDPEEYLVVKETTESLYIIHRETKKIETIRY